MAAGFLGLGSTLIKNVVTVIIKGGLTGYQYCWPCLLCAHWFKTSKSPLPRQTPGIWPSLVPRGVGNLTRRAFPREGNLTFSRVGWGIWTKSVKFNLLSSFLCQTTLFQSNIFLVAKWRSTRKCQRNNFEQLCTSTCQPMTSCVLCTFPVWPTGNGNHLLCLCNSFAFLPCRTRLYERVCYRDLRDNFYKCSYCSSTLKQQRDTCKLLL